MLITIIAALAAAAEPMPEFLTGCWEEVEGSRWTEECWMEPRAQVMLGATREGDGDRLTMWEFARIAPDAQGKLTFYASPRGAPASAFPRASSGKNHVEFASPAHDYPQRIRYERKGERLDATISLLDGSKAVRWSYRRKGSSIGR